MLNVTQIKNLKPTDKRKKYAMGGGMYIEVMPTGKMTWRLKFRWDGTEQIFTIGDLKVVSLAQAQLAREQAKALLRDGINPNSQKKASLAQDKAAMPLNELVSIYIDKAVPTHKGAKWEVLRLEKFRRTILFLDCHLYLRGLVLVAPVSKHQRVWWLLICLTLRHYPSDRRTC